MFFPEGLYNKIRLWFKSLRQIKKPSHLVKVYEVRAKGLEPPHLAALDPKSSVYLPKISQIS